MVIRIGELTRDLKVSTSTLLSTAREHSINLIDLSRSKHSQKKIYAIAYEDVPRLREVIVSMRRQREEARQRKLEKKVAMKERKENLSAKLPKNRVKGKEILEKLDLIIQSLELIVSELGIKRNNSTVAREGVSRDAH